MIDLKDPYKRIIWSADVGTTRRLLELLEGMEPSKTPVVKIDRPFLARRGNGHWRIFEHLAQRDIVVFDDAKIWGTPREVRDETINHLVGPKPWLLNCAAGVVSNQRFDLSGDTADSLKQFADLCHEAGVKPCGVTVLTTTKPMVAKAQFRRSAIAQVAWYADMLKQAKFTHVVCSPLEISVVLERGLIPVIPGIRPAGAEAGQQARFTTPTQAIQDGASYIVVGSPITNGSGTPAENLDEIAVEVAAVL